MALAEDGSAVLAGLAYGDWDGESSGFTDFAAVKVDRDGRELWRWQVSSSPKRGSPGANNDPMY